MKSQAISPLSNTEISAFCSQMSMILSAGISSTEGLSLLLDDSTSPDERMLLKKIFDSLNETGSLNEALSSTRAFPEYLLQMLTIAEQTGNMDTVFEALAIHYEREASIAQSIKNAVTFPMIMITMMIVVIIILITRVMPIFNQVFRQLGTEMTGLSKILLDLGQGINHYFIILVALIVIITALLLFFAMTKHGRRSFAKLSSTLPVLRGLSEQVAAGRFASGMYLTIKSGLSPVECINMSSKLTHNGPFLQKVTVCQEKVENGEELSSALLGSHIFTGLYAKMTSIGSKTGALDETLNKIATHYNDEIDQKFTTIIATLEPTLVIILSIIVGMILLSVMLPLMGILSSM